MSEETPLEINKTVQILYTNYRHETSIRKIIPSRIWFGSTPWHPEQQWLLDAFDIDRGESRSFAVADIRAWFK
ncbi:MAG TPA: hypothetical protein VLS89_19700 [Candidatus Nanopelagicales bacterium]|nr:hypothetical protein [Candidatus Nanopelagicales bacterium]